MTIKLPFKWHSGVVDSLVDFETVRPHARNPNNGDEELVRDSIIRNGVYRHIYAHKRSKEIVAGHTQYHVEVQLQLDAGVERPVVPVSWVDGDSKTMLRILTADNGTAAHARMDDALLLDLLNDFDDLLGTGYVDDDLAKLEAKINGVTDLAGEWDGMPDYSNEKLGFQTIAVHFVDEEARDHFAKLIGQPITDATKYVWHPRQEQDQVADLAFVSE